MRPTVPCLHKRYFFSTVVVMLLGLLIELAKIDVIIFSGPDVMRSVFTKKLTFGNEKKTDPNTEEFTVLTVNWLR